MFKVLLPLFLFFSVLAYGQNGQVEMADTMRSEGKIYVVVATIVVILLGFVLYLIFLDRKIGRVERQMKDSAGKRP